MTSVKWLSSSCCYSRVMLKAIKVLLHMICLEIHIHDLYNQYCTVTAEKGRYDAQGLTVGTNRITSGLTNWLVPFQVKHAISNMPGVQGPMGLCSHTDWGAPQTLHHNSTYILLQVSMQTLQGADLQYITTDMFLCNHASLSPTVAVIGVLVYPL